MLKKMFVVTMLVVALLAISIPAFAMTTPVAGDFLYAVYDFGIVKGLQGVIGAVLVIIFFLLGVAAFTKSPLAAFPLFIIAIVIASVGAIPGWFGMIF